MPPKQNYSRELVLAAADKIMRERGFEAVNARSLAKELNCSTQPIYSYYATMEALKAELYDYAVSRFMDKVNCHKDDSDFLAFANRIFIQTAVQEKHLFRFIYLSHSCDGESLHELLTKYESNRLILARLCEDYHLTQEIGRTVFYKIWFFIFGISSMLCTNEVNTTDEEIFALVNEMVTTILREATANSREA